MVYEGYIVIKLMILLLLHMLVDDEQVMQHIQVFIHYINLHLGLILYDFVVQNNNV